MYPAIGRQLLLWNRPTDFAAALKDANKVEYTLEFDGQDDTIIVIGYKAQKTIQIQDVSLH